MERVPLRLRSRVSGAVSESSYSSCSFDHDCTDEQAADVNSLEAHVPASSHSADGSEQTEPPLDLPSPTMRESRTVTWKDTPKVYGSVPGRAGDHAGDIRTQEGPHCLVVVEQAWADLYPEIARKPDRSGVRKAKGFDKASSATATSSNLSSRLTTPETETRDARSELSKAPFRQRLTDVQGKLQALAQEVRSHADLAGLPIESCDSELMHKEQDDSTAVEKYGDCLYSAFDARLQHIESAFTALGNKVDLLLLQNQQRQSDGLQREALLLNKTRALETISAQLQSETSSQLAGLAAHIRKQADKQISDVLSEADSMLAAADVQFKQLLARADTQLSEQKQCISRLEEQQHRILEGVKSATDAPGLIRDSSTPRSTPRSALQSLSSWGNMNQPASTPRAKSSGAMPVTLKNSEQHTHIPRSQAWEGPRIPATCAERATGISALRPAPPAVVTTPRGQASTESSTPRTPRMMADRRLVEVQVQPANSRKCSNVESAASRTEGPALRIVELTEPVTVQAWASSQDL